METVVERPAALDVHKEQVTGCVRVPGEGGGREQRVAEFPTTVRGLLSLHDWLAAHRVQQVTIEATGVYWRAAVGDPRGRLRVRAGQRPACQERGVGLALRLLSDRVLEQSSLVGFDLDA